MALMAKSCGLGAREQGTHLHKTLCLVRHGLLHSPAGQRSAACTLPLLLLLLSACQGAQQCMDECSQQ